MTFVTDERILEPKGTLDTVIMSDSQPRRLLQYGRGIMVNLYFIFCKLNANSNRLFVLWSPTVLFSPSIDY